MKAVILDVDGTLLDSNDAHAHAFVQAMNEEGYDPSFERVRRLIGKGGDKLLPDAIGIEADSEAGERMKARKRDVLKGMLGRIRPTPGARELLEALRERGLRLVVASSGSREDLESLLAAGGLDGMFDELISASEVESSKPDPDALQAALDATDAEPSEVVMLGDTPYDVEACRRAGVTMIAVRCGGWSDAGLTGADAVYDDPADLLAHLEQSPLRG